MTDGEHWDVAHIVAELRELRVHALEQRQRRDRPPRLPSRKALVEVMEALSGVLFPYRLGHPEITDDSIDYHVGHGLDVALRALNREIQRELTFTAGRGPTAATPPRAETITAAFAAQLPTVRALLDSDILAAYRGDPAAGSVDEVLVCYPGIKAVIHHRLAHVLHRHGAPLCARIISEIAHATTGVDIHPGARIGESFFIDHGSGVVIGETTVIGRNVRLYHAVTLGAKRFPVNEDGTLVKGAPRHPTVEDDVVIYAGATILGRITIGKGSVIGGNVWLTRSVPPGSSISQTRARQSRDDAAPTAIDASTSH